MTKALRTLSVALLILATSCSSQTLKEPTDNEKRADVLLQAGVEALEKKEYSLALRNLLDAQKYNPQSALILTDLGVAYAGKSDFAKAEEMWKKAIKADPKHSDARINLALLNVRKKNFPEAERLLKEATRDPAYSKLDQVALQLANIYQAQGRPLLVEQQLKIAVQENSDLCPAWLRLGMIQKERGDYAEAAKSLKGSVNGTCYKNPHAHYEIATLYLKAHEMHLAKTKLLEIIQLFPASEWASRAEETLNMIR
ncbi:MAG TPA: tetratricopeptide repeat protein [Bdellovibrionota bacterium]|jgi:Tfp pilus assembly protein PilF